ncbi:hypothetical protein PAXRUDRAFT_114006, partial [Paxillus rubicundulus Ve08.2h10]
VAHAIFQLNSLQAADTLLQEGLYICKDKLHPTKDKREPIRCTCCQKWGHIARDCKANHNTCTICGLQHRTVNCDSLKMYHCVGCDTHTHSRNDPYCLTYERKCEELNAKHPEKSMPYFPTDEEW